MVVSLSLHMFRCFKLALVCVVTLLWGCRSNPTFDTLSTLSPWRAQYAAVQPGMEYVWVSLDGRASVMALGERTVQGHGDGRHVHERWYTGQGEMLYMVDGRIQQALGFTHEWRGQTSTPPAWDAVLSNTRELSWRRTLDVMPGYRYNLIDNITTYKTTAPKRLPEGVSPQTQWVADLVSSKGDDGLDWWYLQKFALLDGRVVYSEQCVAKALCLALRPLGVVVPAK
jgi:hypothetical protein